MSRGNRTIKCQRKAVGLFYENLTTGLKENVPFVWNPCEVAGREPNSSVHRDCDEGTQDEKGPIDSVLRQVTSQAMSPPGLLTPWAAWPLAFQIMPSHLIKCSQCPQIKFKVDGSPEGPVRPGTFVWHPSQVFWKFYHYGIPFGSLDSPSLETDYPLPSKLRPHPPGLLNPSCHKRSLGIFSCPSFNLCAFLSSPVYVNISPVPGRHPVRAVSGSRLLLYLCTE